MAPTVSGTKSAITNQNQSSSDQPTTPVTPLPAARTRVIANPPPNGKCPPRSTQAALSSPPRMDLLHQALEQAALEQTSDELRESGGPALPGLHQVMNGNNVAGAAALQRRMDPSLASSRGASTASLSTPAQAVVEHQQLRNQVVTLDGAGFALSQGRVYQWNNANNSWNRLPMADIAALRSGGDGQAYACTHDGQILALTGSKPTQVLTQIPADHADFAVSLGGAVASIHGASEGSAGATTLHWQPPASAKGKGSPLHLPLPETAGHPRSIAFAGDGKLYVLDQKGRVWRANPQAVREEGAKAWRALDKPAGEPLAALKTLPNRLPGGISGTGSNEALLRLEHDGTWQPHHGETALQDTYGHYPVSDHDYSSVTLGSFATPGSAANRRDDQGVLASKLSRFKSEPGQQVARRSGAALAQTAETLAPTARHANYFKGHYGITTERGANNAVIRNHLDAGKRFVALTQSGVLTGFDTTPLGTPERTRLTASSPGDKGRLGPLLLQEIATPVVANANTALGKLEATLNTPLNGRPVSAEFVARPGAAGLHDNNMLHDLREQVRALFPSAQKPPQVTQLLTTLDRLIDTRRIQFKPNEWRKQESSGHAFCAVQIGKIAHDLTLAAQALAEVQARPDERESRLVSESMIKEMSARINDPNEGLTNRQFAAFADLHQFTQAREPRSLDQQMSDNWRDLTRLPDTHALPGPVRQTLLPLADGHLASSLVRIEKALRTRDTDDRPVSPWRSESRWMGPTPAKVWSDDNALYLLLRRRSQSVHGAPINPPQADSVELREVPHTPEAALTERLYKLLEQGVFVARPRTESAAAGGLGALASRAAHAVSEATTGALDGLRSERGVDVLVAQLLLDQLAVEEAAQSHGGMTLARAEARIEGSDGNKVSHLFNKEIWDSRAETQLKVLSDIQTNLRHPDHVLNRAARFQGVLGQDHAEDYVAMVSEMKTGSTIKFEFSWMAGLDADGLSHNQNITARDPEGIVDHPGDPTKRIFNIPFNRIPNFLPMPAISTRVTRAMSVTKKADGIDITVHDGKEGEVKLLSTKLKWGLGRYEQNHMPNHAGKDTHTATGVGFMGIEVVPAVLVLGAKGENSIRLSIKDSDQSERNVNHVVRQLFSGQLNPDDLVKAAADLSYTRASSMSLNNGIDLQALVAVLGVFNPPEDLTHRFKAVLAGVKQLSVGLNFKKESATTQDRDGIKKQIGQWQAEASGDHKWIAVTELQSSFIKELESVTSLEGFTKNLKIGDGYEMENKMPPWIDLHIKKLFGPTALWKSPTIEMDVNGGLSRISYGVSSRKTFDPAQLPQWGWLQKNAPEIANNIRVAADAALREDLPIDAEMELSPDATQVLARHLQSAGQKGVAEELNRMIENPENWQLKRVSVSATHGYNTTLLAGASAARYNSDAKNTYTQNLAVIELDYSAAHLPNAEVAGRMSVGGGTPRFEQLDALLRGSTADTLFAVSNADAPPALRYIAGMPKGPLTQRKLDEHIRAGLSRGFPPEGVPHLALHNGVPVARFPIGHGDSQQFAEVELPDSAIQTLLTRIPPNTPPSMREHPGSDTLLALMSARSSGRLLAADPTRLFDRATLNNWAAHATPLPEGALPARPGKPGSVIHPHSLLTNADLLNDPHAQANLDPAQHYVLRQYFGTPQGDIDWPVLHEIHQSPVASAGFGHAIDQAARRSTASTATPQHLPESLQHTTQSVPSNNAMPTAVQPSI